MKAIRITKAVHKFRARHLPVCLKDSINTEKEKIANVVRSAPYGMSPEISDFQNQDDSNY